MTNNYARGRAFEYRVWHHLEGLGWTVFRTAGSHSPADLLALKCGEVALVQCKAGNGYMPPLERQTILGLAGELGVMAILAYKDGRKLVLEKLCQRNGKGV